MSEGLKRTKPVAEKYEKRIFIHGSNTISLTIEKRPEGEEVVEFNGKTKSDLNLKPSQSIEEYAYEVLRKEYKKYFSETFENLIFLTGAGSSKGIGKEEKKGLLTSEFWDKITDQLNEKYKDEEVLTELCNLVDYDGKNIEELLSKIFLLTGINPEPKIKTSKGTEHSVKEIVSEIESKIKELCTLDLPEDSPHKELIRKACKRKASLPRIKIFTLNYDLLFEQAATELNAVVIDGFSFSFPRVFSGRNFDYDLVKRENTKLKKDEDYIERVVHLYKPHGSINWSERGTPSKVQIEEKPDKALMIYPRSNKYEASYEQPFFEMMSRFQNVLRQENTTLVTIGFSFSDKHIVTAIIEAFNQNPSFNLIIVDPFFDTTSSNVLKTLIEYASKTNRIMFIGEYFSDFASTFPENKSYPESEFQKIDLSYSKTEDSQRKEVEEAKRNDQEPPPF